MEVMADFFDRFGQTILSLLPLSPFTQFLDDFSINGEWLAWLNWFFPVTECLTVCAAWLIAIGVFYLYQLVMRWVGMIS